MKNVSCTLLLVLFGLDSDLEIKVVKCPKNNPKSKSWERVILKKSDLEKINCSTKSIRP